MDGEASWASKYWRHWNGVWWGLRPLYDRMMTTWSVLTSDCTIEWGLPKAFSSGKKEETIGHPHSDFATFEGKNMFKSKTCVSLLWWLNLAHKNKQPRGTTKVLGHSYLSFSLMSLSIPPPPQGKSYKDKLWPKFAWPGASYINNEDANQILSPISTSGVLQKSTFLFLTFWVDGPKTVEPFFPLK